MTTSSSELKRSLSMSQLIFMGLVFIGPHTGYIAGWMILLDYVLVPSIAFMIAGIAINSLFPAIPLWLIVTIAIIIGTGLNLAGISIAKFVQTTRSKV